mgnify:CR=1 FL=1
MKTTISLSLFVLLVISIQCKPVNTISRISPDSITELSGKWNDTDARLVSQEMIGDALSNRWLGNYTEVLKPNMKSSLDSLNPRRIKDYYLSW